MYHLFILLPAFLHSTCARQTPLKQADIVSDPWIAKYGAFQPDLAYTGPLSFSHIPYSKCLENPDQAFDLAIFGMPFDTTTSYRPGARFGPAGIRHGSRRQHPDSGYTLPWGRSPYAMGAKIIDCGDVPVNAFDNNLAIEQMQAAYASLVSRPVVNGTLSIYGANAQRSSKPHPRVITLGGDHTIVLPILRALFPIYGPISVIHFDSHPDSTPVHSNATNSVSHGSYFTFAHREGLMSNTSIHAGIRQKYTGSEFIKHDETVGFQIIAADDIDEIGVEGIIKVIRKRVGDGPVYLTFDIDTLDPVFAPATGTPESGGWSTREAKRIIRGLSGLNFIGADIVEVAPAYDQADITNIAAADLVHEFLTMMLSEEPPKPRWGNIDHL